MNERIRINTDGLVFVLMSKSPLDFDCNKPAEEAAVKIKAYLSGTASPTVAAGCMTLPYPSGYTSSLKKMRTGEVQRTGFLNMDFGKGMTKRVPALSLSWDVMSYDMFSKILDFTYGDEFWLYYYDTAAKEMRANLFYCEDDGLKAGEIWAEYDQNDALLSGYKNVQTEFIATLNDDEEVLRANNIAYGVDGVLNGGK